MKFQRIALLSVLLLAATTVMAKIKLPAIIGDNMVLQQQFMPALWGSATANARVTLITSWNKRVYTVKADDHGAWKVKIATPAAGGPYQISITDGEKLVLKNIMIGEVWVCSGQSNMEMPMRGFKNSPILNSNDLILEAGNPSLRLFKVARANPLTPQKDCKGEWNESTPVTAREFSAVAYQFGSRLQKQLKVPVGLILSTVGGTMIETWMSKNSLSNFPEVKIPVNIDTVKQPYKLPTTLFNGMIAPIMGYGIKGFIWYQGESNRQEPVLYERLFPAMVSDWRKQWNIAGDLPFYYVQIAPFGSKDTTRSGTRLREAQLNDMKLIPNSGMAVTMDVGLEKNVHFYDKTPVSKRLLYWALAKTYHQKGIAFSGPVYKSLLINGNKAIVSFDYVEAGITSYNKEMANFEIAGANKIFYPAKATINADATITVTSDQVKQPIAVRYAYKEFVIGELYNNEGLPASSFRTDNWGKWGNN